MCCLWSLADTCALRGCINLLHYCYPSPIEQSPSWEANSFSASQEIAVILWKTTLRCHVDKSPPPVPILSQINPLHGPILCLDDPLSSHLCLGLPGGFFPSGFPTKKPYVHFCSVTYVQRNSPMLIWEVSVMKLKTARTSDFLIAATKRFVLDGSECMGGCLTVTFSQTQHFSFSGRCGGH